MLMGEVLLMEELELKSFEIISNVGSARSSYIEAIKYAKKYEFEKAEDSMSKGLEAFHAGHRAHSELIGKEANGEHLPFSLILVHAEDQLMSAEAFKIIADEFIDLYKRLSANKLIN